MANSMALLLLLILAAVASTTAQLHEKEPLVEHDEPASSTSVEELLAAIAAVAAAAERHERKPHVVEPASTTDEPDDVFPADEGGYKTYLIELEPPGGGQETDADAASAWHRSFLPSATTAQGKPRLRYSFRTVFTGFAAWLTEEELKELCAKPGVVRSFEDIIYRAQTTHHLPTSASFVDLRHERYMFD